MTASKTITLAGRKFPVPPLPFRVNREVFPICHRLDKGGLIRRTIDAGGILDCSTEEMDDLAEIAFLAIGAGGSDMSREAFDTLPITPPEFTGAFLVIRVQTGAWVEVASKPGADIASGEAKGTPAPRKRRPRT